MNREETLAMEAGRELDAIVEEKLFNHQIERRYFNWLPEGYFEVQSYYDPNLPRNEQVIGGLLDEDELHPCYKDKGKWAIVPFYSTNISAAWEVVIKMHGEGYVPTMTWISLSCSCTFSKGALAVEGVVCVAAPEAICKAALIAKYSTRET